MYPNSQQDHIIKRQVIYLPNQSRNSTGHAQPMDDADEGAAAGEATTTGWMTKQSGIKHQTNLITLQALRAEQTIAAPLSSYSKGSSSTDDDRCVKHADSSSHPPLTAASLRC